jgi:hypothetical protein
VDRADALASLGLCAVSATCPSSCSCWVLPR